jgi:hypothetical protein
LRPGRSGFALVSGEGIFGILQMDFRERPL